MFSPNLIVPPVSQPLPPAASHSDRPPEFWIFPVVDGAGVVTQSSQPDRERERAREAETEREIKRGKEREERKRGRGDPAGIWFQEMTF